MTDAHDSFRKKVEDIFTELVGPARANWLKPGVPSRCMGQIAQAVASESGYAKETAGSIAINVADWQADAAFLVALHLFPERFTDEEIDAAVGSLLIHVPAHVIAAARLAGHPTEDIFAELESRAELGATPDGGARRRRAVRRPRKGRHR
jgi:hypothetical protein